ncbi:hypothetical protein KKE48_04985 [Patescibacteria group bacterium]|nr:hypothetical protein [Patescibacteria group bacterium]
MKIIKKGPTLMGLFLQKGRILGSVLNESWFSKRTDPIVQGLSLTGGLANGQAGAAKLKGPTLTGFSPSPKLSPGLSNQPKTFIYLFWQSQCQIANLSPIL